MLKQLVRKFRRRKSRPDFEYVPEGWQRAQKSTEIKGWNVESVVNTQAARWEQTRPLLAAGAPLGASETADGRVRCDLAAHNTLISFAYVAALASRNRTCLSLLDWGGGIGQYGAIAEVVLPGVEIDYFCQDVPVQCRVGRRVTPHGTFIDAGQDLGPRKFDLVLASGALQYVEDWQDALAKLAAAASGYLFVTRLPVVLAAESFVILQRAQAYGYDTQYLGWCFNRDEFLAVAESRGAVLLREFCLEAPCSIVGAPAVCQSQGFLFRVE